MARVVVGMSGGVDSSVAAALLQEQGHEVIGATMLVWSPPGVEMNYSDSCCGLSAAEDARRVCARLGIRHYTFDLKDLFYETVIQDYVAEYRQGRTPNPCVLCNEFVKFRAFLDRALALGADHVATGHYARVRRDEERGRWLLLRGADRAKDQSYALYRLSQEQLSRTLFPLGELTKPRVRALARELELPTAGKPDSQETCFVPNNDYPALLQILAPGAFSPGEVRSPEGQLLGRHLGVPHYTIGQRRRINVGSSVPLYVTALDPEANTVTVAPAGHPALQTQDVRAHRVNLISLPDECGSVGVWGYGSGTPPQPSTINHHTHTPTHPHTHTPTHPHTPPLTVTAKIRYNAADQPAALTLTGEGTEVEMHVRFEEPVRAVTPGQSIVCYLGDEVLGGGIILG